MLIYMYVNLQPLNTLEEQPKRCCILCFFVDNVTSQVQELNLVCTLQSTNNGNGCSPA